MAALLRLPVPLVIGGLAVLACLPMLWMAVLRRRTVVAAGAGLLFALTIFAGYRSMQLLHQQGRGSDQADCVVVGSQLLVQGQWPYQPAKLWTGNALSCGPGWIALQMPATAIAGYPTNLLIMWLATMGVLVWSAGGRAATGWIALLAVAPVCLLGLFNGTDFLSFGILSTALLALSEQPRSLGWAKIPTILVTSLVDQFRVPTLILPVLLRHAVGRWLALAGVALTLGWQVVFFRWNPMSFATDGPWHILRKLSSLPLMGGSARFFSAPVWVLTMLVLSAFLLSWIAGRFPVRRLYAALLALMFGVPAVLDLLKKFGQAGDLSGTLRTWEGGLWLCGLLPILAYCAVVAEPVEVRR